MQPLNRRFDEPPLFATTRREPPVVVAQPRVESRPEPEVFHRFDDNAFAASDTWAEDDTSDFELTEAEAAAFAAVGQEPGFEPVARDAAAPARPYMRSAEQRREGQAARAVRRDPAPSILAYRMQRVMLTPYLRALLRVGLPVLLVAGVCGLWFSDQSRRDALVGTFTELREKFEQRPEFMVRLASIEGSSKDLADAVREHLALDLPKSSFDLDLEAARAQIEDYFDAVKSAELRVRSGGILQILLTEREPVAVWRMPEGLTLVDETGHRVAGLVERGDRGDLPLIAGRGADEATPEALEILAATGPLAPRVRGLVRIGERRWDLVLDRNQSILLPDQAPVRALERLIALDQAQDILARDVTAVDLRIGQRPTLRLTTHALNEMRRSRGLAIVETEL